MRSKIDPSLKQAYRVARYRVIEGRNPFSMAVGTRSPELSSLLEESGCEEAVFITAWNPFSQRLSQSDNQSAQAALKADLKKAGCIVLGGSGEDPAGQWPSEPSFLALGLGLAAAKTLGVKYGQNALLWADREAVPRLILLR